MSDVTHIRVKTYSIHKTEDRNLKKDSHSKCGCGRGSKV